MISNFIGSPGRMDSSQSTKFLDAALKLTDIYCNSKEVLVKFQGQYNTECEFDYHILQNEIQQVSKVKDSLGVGEFCLIEDTGCGEWFRGRVIQKNKHLCEVFLIDSGKILAVHDNHIASAIDELFQIPPKMVCGIFANILPAEERWSPKALNYFSSLRNLQVKGSVQAILPQQMFLLDVPKITNDVVELKLGKIVDGDSFQLIVKLLTELPQPDLLQQKYTRPDSVYCSARFQPDFYLFRSDLHPRLSVGRLEKVKISVAVSPSRFYCQLLQCQIELNKLTSSMSSFYENISRENVPSFDNVGVLCAARRKNGEWQRGVIQQLLSDGKVKVWFVDFGNCEDVPAPCVLKLQSKFISVPQFAFPCSLSCLSEADEALRNNQLREFKEVLLRQRACYAHIDLFNRSEHLYYVTLHKCESVMDDDECQAQESEVVPPLYSSFPSEIVNASENMNIPDTNSLFPEHVHGNMLLLTGQGEDSSLETLSKTAEMKVDCDCVAFVQYVLNPSNFWVQTNDYVEEFNDLMKKIEAVYDAGDTDKRPVANPEPGMLCCARYAKDMHFYRAIIQEVIDNDIHVYFLDFGNTETVSRFDVENLLPEFQELPALAICCSLANALPVNDIWIKKDTDFFKAVVFDKPLTLHAIVKQNRKYIVNVQCLYGLEQIDVLTYMVEARCAEYWEVKQARFLNVVRDSPVPESFLKHEIITGKCLRQEQNPIMAPNPQTLLNPPVTEERAAAAPCWANIWSHQRGKGPGKHGLGVLYKQYWFKPGTILDVVCCHIISPGDFSCQLQSKLPALNKLMEQIQLHYRTQTCPYENGHLACVVRLPKTGKWHRAVVMGSVSDTEVDVLLVDTGSWERVPLKDLQAILPDFLVLECQAFRCCLNSVPQGSSFDPLNWSAEACSDFESFIASSKGLLTCTVSALIVRSPNYLYNAVDLQSPFFSDKQFFLECGHGQFWPLEFTRSLAPPFSLYSFCYSSFNVTIGNEEEVCVTHIYSPTKFYCQLNRNLNDINKLFQKTAEISQTTSYVCQRNVPTGRLCLAKYFEDGFFYRALIYPMDSSDYLPVYFVDFGNKQLVAKVDLIPIPDHASEILFTPMQAIKCYLSGLKDTEIPAEINTWFEMNYLGKELKVVIISKEPDGQLGVELYDNSLQINREIKELLLEHKKTCDLDPKDINRCAERPIGDVSMGHQIQVGAVKTKAKSEKVGSGKEAENKVDGGKLSIDVQKQCIESIKLPTPFQNTELKFQNTLKKRISTTHEELRTDSVKYPPLELKQLTADIQNSSGKEMNNAARRKYTDLPERNIQPNSKALAYISSLTSPSSFCIHLAEDEEEIVRLAKDLNQESSMLEPETDAKLEEGDLVLAESDIDCCIYRAVVKEIKSEQSYEAEFIDYGNISTVDASKIYKMKRELFSLPRLSIRCFLSKTNHTFPDRNWSSEDTACLLSTVNNELLVCEFLQQHSQLWEVDLVSHGLPVIGELMQREATLELQNIISTEKVVKLHPIADTDMDGNTQSRKSESQNKCDLFKHETSWENLSPIAYQKIKPGQLERAEIRHVSKAWNFYVRLTKDVQALFSLNLRTNQEAETNTLLPVENIKEGLECLAKSRETLKWYRSDIITKFVKEESMLVFFMDLGKYEMVSLHDAKILSDELRSIPRHAVLCQWIWTESLGGLSFERVMTQIAYHNEIKILFLEYVETSFIWKVDIVVDGILLLEYWNQMSNEEKLDRGNSLATISMVHRAMPDLSFRLNSVSWTLFQSERHYRVFVTTVIDPSKFWIQLEDSLKTMEALFKLLSELPEHLPTVPQELVTPGACGLMKNASTGEWNRVEVSEITNQFILLSFIDDGLSVFIPIMDIIHKLKIIPEKLVELPRLTYPCSLFGVSPAYGEEWSSEARLSIQEFLSRPGLVFKIKPYSGERKLEADVFDKCSSAADVLVASGCAVYSKTASPLDSNNWAEQNPLTLQIVGGQKSSEVQITLLSEKEEEPQKSELQFRYTYGKVIKQSSVERQRCRKNRAQKGHYHSQRRNHNTQL